MHHIADEAVAGVLVDPDEVMQLINDVMSSPSYRPPMLPAAAVEIHNLSRKRDVDFPAVVQVLETDAVLASEALRLAQSPAFARATPPTTLLAAVSRMGLGMIRDLAFQYAINTKVFRAPRYKDAMEAIRRHSVASAHVARLLAKGTPLSEYAFLIGLLHDVGAAAIVLVLNEVKHDCQGACAATVVQRLHEDAGVVLHRAWNLPVDFESAVSKHDYPKDKVGALAHVAHAVASQCGHGLTIGGEEIEDNKERQLEQACVLLNLKPEALAKLTQEAKAMLDAI